jgi:hypothetical protein
MKRILFYLIVGASIVVPYVQAKTQNLPTFGQGNMVYSDKLLDSAK